MLAYTGLSRQDWGLCLSWNTLVANFGNTFCLLYVLLYRFAMPLYWRPRAGLYQHGYTAFAVPLYWRPRAGLYQHATLLGLYKHALLIVVVSYLGASRSSHTLARHIFTV